MQLFSISTNAKTVKGEKLGYLTGVLYLAPASFPDIKSAPWRVPHNARKLV
jgi:hypothetical protein